MTEGGYYLNTRHQLETSNPDLQADLQGECKTIYGTLARILEKRMADNAGPLTLLNCDNVRHNGERFHDGMVEFLQLTGKQAVIDWMAANTTCPNTMVDRITPRPAADLPARIKAQTGIDDKAPVMGGDLYPVGSGEQLPRCPPESGGGRRGDGGVGHPV